MLILDLPTQLEEKHVYKKLSPHLRLGSIVVQPDIFVPIPAPLLLVSLYNTFCKKRKSSTHFPWQSKGYQPSICSHVSTCTYTYRIQAVFSTCVTFVTSQGLGIRSGRFSLGTVVRNMGLLCSPELLLLGGCICPCSY